MIKLLISNFTSNKLDPDVRDICYRYHFDKDGDDLHFLILCLWIIRKIKELISIMMQSIIL